MDSEIKHKLDAIMSQVEENHRLIKKVRSTQKTAQTIKVIYWVLLVGLALGAYYYVKPVYENLMGAYQKSSENIKTIGGLGLPGVEEIQNLLR